MLDEAKASLFDMVQASGLIVDFTAGKDFAAYRNDIYCKSAVERQFQIIGEALNRLAKRHPEVADRIPSCRTIINFRNILVHGYDRIEDDVVWGIISAHLPALRSAVVQMLQEE
jgi:uncharacterized protein with HEPN domain